MALEVRVIVLDAGVEDGPGDVAPERLVAGVRRRRVDRRDRRLEQCALRLVAPDALDEEALHPELGRQLLRLAASQIGGEIPAHPLQPQVVFRSFGDASDLRDQLVADLLERLRADGWLDELDEHGVPGFARRVLQPPDQVARNDERRDGLEEIDANDLANRTAHHVGPQISAT